MEPNDILGYIRYVVADHNVPPDHGTESCKILVDESESNSPFERLVAFLLHQSPSICSAYESDYPNDGKNVFYLIFLYVNSIKTENIGLAGTAWNYQTCTEFGYTVTTTSAKQPFNDSKKGVEEDVETCIGLFGEK